MSNYRFQSTLPRGERQICQAISNLGFKFQSTLPRGERRKRNCGNQDVSYFNPRSREGSDKRSRKSAFTDQRISIHAPARGATPVWFSSVITFFNFNPRSREGSDKEGAAPETEDDDFNPRSREGSDDNSFQQVFVHLISIHAPARGATLRQLECLQSAVFQSTLPRGERPFRILATSPRLSISIHAPARGATEICRRQ